MTAIPFSAKAYGGFGAVKGLIRAEGGALVLEYQVKDAVLGVLTSSPKEVRVPLDQVVSMVLDEGWFNTRLRIQSSRLCTWAGFPDSDMGRVELNLDRADRDNARALIARVQPKQHPIDQDLA